MITGWTELRYIKKTLFTPAGTGKTPSGRGKTPSGRGWAVKPEGFFG